MSDLEGVALYGYPEAVTSVGFEQITTSLADREWGPLKAGDVLLRSGHVAIYVGDATAESSGGIFSYEKDTIDLDSIQKKLKYSGLPKTIVYSGSKAFPDIFDFLKGLLDWLVGLLFLGLKIVAMGLTELCENIVNDIMKLVNNTVISS